MPEHAPLQPCSLETVLGNRRGLIGAPPESIVSTGVACFAPEFMRRNHLYLCQPVEIRLSTPVSGRAVAHAWPLSVVNDGLVALDSTTVDSLGLQPCNLSSNRAGTAPQSITPNRRSKSKHSRDTRSPRKGRSSPATLIRDHVNNQRFDAEHGERDADDFAVAGILVDALDEHAIEEASAVLLGLELSSPALLGPLKSDIYASHLRGTLLNRVVRKGTHFVTTLLGSEMRFVVLEVKGFENTGVASVTSRTRIEFKTSATSADSSSALGASAGGIDDDEGVTAVGGLSRQIDVILGLARAALSTASTGLDRAGFRERRPRGILLYGPPGTGKTMLARGIARACDARLEVVSGPDVVGSMAGESESALVAAFSRANRNRPCILLLDEVDAIGPRRDGVDIGSAERRLTAALLNLMDGNANSEQGMISADLGGIFVVGTTNRPDAIDPALRRAGRFDREIEIPVPDARGRLDILCRIVSTAKSSGLLNVEMDELGEVARKAYGFVGADLAALWRESVSSSLRRAQLQSESEKHVNLEDMNNALGLIKPSALREVEVEIPRVRWTDIGGMDSVKTRLREAVELPLTPGGAELFHRIGISSPRGILLFGPPGCSKTLLAKAVATESGANFISVKGPELLSKWVGESEKAVRETFRKARLAAPCVIFFDEIDALASSRGAGGSATSRVVAQLLTEMDGIDCSPSFGPEKREEEARGHEMEAGGTKEVANVADTRVVVIAATNRPDLLDAALLRPGRLGVQLHVGLPDEAARRAVLRVHCSRVPLAADVELERYAADGGPADKMTGAELAAVVREAALAAMEEDLENAEQVCSRHFELALTRVRPRTPRETLEYFERYVKQTRNVLQ